MINKMLHLTLYLLTTLELAIVVQGQRVHPAIIPDLPPPPTFTPVPVNGSLNVTIGESVTVRPGQGIRIDCEPLIKVVRNAGLNPNVVWWKNDTGPTANLSQINTIISPDNRFLLIIATLNRGGELGNSGCYTCRVCGGDSNIVWFNDTSCQTTCGVPHLVPPVNPPLVLPTIISLTCGQHVTVPTLIGLSSVIITCDKFNGSEPFTTTVYKDGTIVGSSTPLTIVNPTDDDFGTYTVVVSTEQCGATHAVSRILQEGDPPSINTTMIEKPIPGPGNKRVNVGIPVNISSGANLTIDCIVTGTPPITIAWIHINDNQIIGSNSSTITIAVTNTTDGVIIMCRADNNIGFDMANTTINVDAEELCFINGTYEFYEDQDLVCINLTLNKPAPCNMTVEVIEESGSATRGIDYESGPYFVNFAKGNKSAKFYINITDDNELEINESFTLRINGSALCPDVSLVKPYEAKVIIMDDEYTFCFERKVYIIPESIGEGEVFLRLSRPLRMDIMVSFTYIDLTASGNNTILRDNIDYYTSYALPNKAIIPAGTTKFLLKVKIVNDKRLEDNEIFRIVADPPDIPNNHFTCSTDVIIRDDDEPIELQFTKLSFIVNEGNGPTQPVLQLSRALDRCNISVRVDIRTITASGDDFVRLPGDYAEVIIPAGQIRAAFAVTIVDDNLFERSETFRVTINETSVPQGVVLGSPRSAVVTILDNDAPTLRFIQETYTVNEDGGLVTVELSLSNPSSSEIHLKVNTVKRTANESDYVFGSYDVVFPVKTTTAILRVNITDDHVNEINETFILAIDKRSVPSHVRVNGGNSTEITIVDDEENCSVTVVRGSIKHNNRSKRTTLRFSSNGHPIVTYECKLDDKNFKNCKSPKVWKNLKKGKHVVTVRAFCTGNRSTTRRRKFKFRIR